jgi:hypothetical protein
MIPFSLLRAKLRPARELHWADTSGFCPPAMCLLAQFALLLRNMTTPQKPQLTTPALSHGGKPVLRYKVRFCLLWDRGFKKWKLPPIGMSKIADTNFCTQ